MDNPTNINNNYQPTYNNNNQYQNTNYNNNMQTNMNNNVNIPQKKSKKYIGTILIAILVDYIFIYLLTIIGIFFIRKITDIDYFQVLSNMFGLTLLGTPIILLYIGLSVFCINHNKAKKEVNEKWKNYYTNKGQSVLISTIIVAIVSGAMEGLGFLVLSTASYKPILYLYPKKKQKIKVKLLKKDNITVSYPHYKNGWNVEADTNGDLIDLDTKRNLYSLYYECKNDYKYKVQKDGFVVKGEDVASFLEEKLAILGLSYREAEEFIVYWLPNLEKNKFNYIRFATIDEINKNMPLEFSEKPDTLIRVLMTYKKLNKPIEIEEQKLDKVERTGFVAVEWGGSEIK